ncbi:hypothetical protein BC835DRAFT_1305613 [Cytidiella melzeri]|nr:hypothetical protein BC835DRAFT_1305613 [Cytidiella melzeri]
MAQNTDCTYTWVSPPPPQGESRKTMISIIIRFKHVSRVKGTLQRVRDNNNNYYYYYYIYALGSDKLFWEQLTRSLCYAPDPWYGRLGGHGHEDIRMNILGASHRRITPDSGDRGGGLCPFGQCSYYRRERLYHFLTHLMRVFSFFFLSRGGGGTGSPKERKKRASVRVEATPLATLLSPFFPSSVSFVTPAEHSTAFCCVDDCGAGVPTRSTKDLYLVTRMYRKTEVESQSGSSCRVSMYTELHPALDLRGGGGVDVPTALSTKRRYTGDMDMRRAALIVT